MNLSKKTLFIILLNSGALFSVPLTTEQKKSVKAAAVEGAKFLSYATGTGLGVFATIYSFSFMRDSIRLPDDENKATSNPYVLAGTFCAVSTYASAQFAWYCLKNGYGVAGNNVRKFFQKKSDQQKKEASLL